MPPEELKLNPMTRVSAKKYEVLEWKEGLNILHAHKAKVNLHNKANPSGWLELKGDFFVAFLPSPYYHLITDIIGEYEILRSYNKSIRLVLFPTKEKWANSVVQKIIELYNPIILNQSGEESVVVFENAYGLLNMQYLSGNSKVGWSTESGLFQNIRFLDCTEYNVGNLAGPRTAMLLAGTYKLLSSKRSKTGGPQKIYSIRNSLPISSDMSIDTKDKEINAVYTTRFHPQEQRLAQYFAKKGYKVVDFSKLSIDQQIDICSSATHFAGTKGSNLVNALFMPPGGQVIGIHTANWWNYDFEHYLTEYGHTYTSVNYKFLFQGGRINLLRPPEHCNIDDVIEELDTLDCL
jgi:hypothetical protein